jgi:soluble P-type ATPase
MSVGKGVKRGYKKLNGLDDGDMITYVELKDNFGLLKDLEEIWHLALDKIPEDLDDLLKKFVVSLLKKAAAKTGNKVDDLLVAQLEKALFES